MAYSQVENSYMDMIAEAYNPTMPSEGTVEVGELKPAEDGYSGKATTDASIVTSQQPTVLADTGQRFGRGGVTKAQSEAAGGLEVPLTGLADTLAGALRGTVAQSLGLPGDIESLVRLLTGGQQVLPTTERFSEMLPPVVPPGAPNAAARQQTAEVAGKLGEFNPVIGAPEAIKLGVKGAKAAGAALAPVAADMMESGLRKSGMIQDIVPSGGAGTALTSKIDLQPGINVNPGNKIGVEQDLRVKISSPDFEMPDKPLLVLSTDEKNVNRQIENLDLIFNKFPNPELTQDSWTKMLGYAFKSDEVPVPPYAAIKALESPENLAAPLRKLTQGQIDDASAGFKNAAQFKNLYTSGKADVVTTGKLFLWSFLSRGVSPYVQEGLFMDAISGIEPFLKKAALGKFNKTDLEEYLAWSSTVAGKGSGQPGSGAIHNLNAFGKNFLTKLAIKDANGITGLQKVHEMMANPNMSGPQIRREFAKIGTGVGIDNKVVSFTLLVSGRDDVLVIDRVQLRNLWDDGRFTGKNLWDGRSEKRMVKKKDGKEVEESAQIAGTALSEITYGAKGLLVYEAIERAMAQRLKDAYRLVGREGDASLGRYHWETWVAGSQQEASHGTIDAIMRESAGVPQPFKGVTAKQGEYGMYDYGAKYGVDESGPYFIYDNSKGDQYRFTVSEYRDMLTAIKNPKSGIVPKDFKVSSSGNAPWFERPEINRSKLDELIAERGSRIGNSPAGEQLIPANGKSPTANATGTKSARARNSIIKGSTIAPSSGAK
jgi:hypothetical protein